MGKHMELGLNKYLSTAIVLMFCGCGVQVTDVSVRTTGVAVAGSEEPSVTNQESVDQQSSSSAAATSTSSSEGEGDQSRDNSSAVNDQNADPQSNARGINEQFNALTSTSCSVVEEGTVTASAIDHTDIGTEDGNKWDVYEPQKCEAWIGVGGEPNKSWTGFRFRNVNLPSKARIKSAKIQLSHPDCWETWKPEAWKYGQWIRVIFNMYGELSAAPADFTKNAGPLPSERNRTTAFVAHNSDVKWLPNTKWEIDVTELAQEIRAAGFGEGTFAFVSKGGEWRWARKFFQPTGANGPKLVIEYETEKPNENRSIAFGDQASDWQGLCAKSPTSVCTDAFNCPMTPGSQGINCDGFAFTNVPEGNNGSVKVNTDAWYDFAAYTKLKGGPVNLKAGGYAYISLAMRGDNPNNPTGWELENPTVVLKGPAGSVSFAPSRLLVKPGTSNRGSLLPNIDDGNWIPMLIPLEGSDLWIRTVNGDLDAVLAAVDQVEIHTDTWEGYTYWFWIDSAKFLTGCL